LPVGLPDVNVIGVKLNIPIRAHVDLTGDRPVSAEKAGAHLRLTQRLK